MGPVSNQARGHVLFRMERRWFQELSLFTLGPYVVAVAVLSALLFLMEVSGVPVEIVYVDAALLLLFLLLFLRFLLSIRPASLELLPDRVRLHYGGRLHREIIFGPEVRVGVVKVGYWDDLTAGPGLRYLDLDPSLHDYQGFGPLFGYSFRSGSAGIEVSRKTYWNLRDIQAMWVPFMDVVRRHHMRPEHSLEWYLGKRMELGLSPDGRGPDSPVPGPTRILDMADEGLF